MRLITLLLFTGFVFQGFSQKQSASNRADWNELAAVSAEFDKSGELNAEALQAFPVYKLRGGIFVSVFGKLTASPDWNYAASNGVIKGSITGNIATCKVPLEKFSSLDFSKLFSYVELPAKAMPHLDKAVKDTRADSVQRGIGLPESFTGKDVFIGVTDWGFDYTHPTFYDTLLQNSRVFAAWDQYRITGDTPASYGYGVEFNTTQELTDAGSDTANIYSFGYHGTHVAGIAGGSGAGKPYRGFAFESKFLFATFLIDAASVIDAFHWMKEKAEAEGKRLVINMSWGLTYMGTLDGNSLLSQAITELASDGVVFVGSAGNNGNVNYHIKKVFDTANSDFEAKIGFNSYTNTGNNRGQSITMWGEENKPFSVRLKIIPVNGSPAFQTPAYSTLTQTAYVDTFYNYGNDTIFYNLSAENASPLNNRPNMRLRVNLPSANYNAILYSTAMDGTVHYWNVTELSTGVGNWGIAFTSYGNFSATPDAQYSIAEPACSPDVITVAAYSSSFTTSSGSQAGGQLASFTSCGPLYTEVMKPDIAGPGVNVASSLSSYTDQSPGTIASANVEFNGRTYKFGPLSGTSMSSPAVAGIVALMLDANSYLSHTEVKNILKTTARTDNHTGVIASPGHVRWGMGKVNAYAAVISAVSEVLSNDELSNSTGMLVYPNPATDKLFVYLPQNTTADRITIISMTGTQTTRSLAGGFADLADFPRGYYIIQVISAEKVFRTPLFLK